MKKWVFVLASILFTSSFCIAFGQEVSASLAYTEQLQSVAHPLMDHNYYLNYKNGTRGKLLNQGVCFPNSFCKLISVENLLRSLQSGTVRFVQSISVPKNSTELLSNIKNLSACRDLGVLNVERLPGSSEEAAVP